MHLYYHLIEQLYYLDMFALKKYNIVQLKVQVLLYLFTQTCYLNKTPLLGVITLFFFLKKYFCSAEHTTQF